MKLEMTGQMRMEQRMKLAPRMIQSMEILQLPIMALQERIEQELNSNPVLEVDEPGADQAPTDQTEAPAGEGDSAGAQTETDDFNRVETLDEPFKEYMNQNEQVRFRYDTSEPDKKLEAIKNTEAPSQSLNDYLSDQWRLVDAEEPVKEAGQRIIDYIDQRGYLSVQLEQLHTKESPFTTDHLREALQRVQQLEPRGVGARDIKECLLIQIADYDGEMTFARDVVADHMDDLMENRLPEIAKKMDCSLDQINEAIRQLSKLDTSPGLQISSERNHPISADVIVEEVEDGQFAVRLADTHLPSLHIRDDYVDMSDNTEVNEKTRKFLKNNIRSAQWIIEAIEQRKNTLLKVAKSIVKYQHDFFEKGQFYLRPLPMAKVADDVGIHLATVSRAVAGKYLRCFWGIIPMRQFFSGGVEDASGEQYSWQAVRAKLQQIIDEEDKSKPLSDDKIREKLAEAGIENIARRTVAKYRQLMNIPSARLRKKY